MKNGFDEKVKGHGFFRKTKAFGLQTLKSLSRK